MPQEAESSVGNPRREARAAADDLGVMPDVGPYIGSDLGLETRLIGRVVHYLSSATSANDACRKLAQRGEPEGLVVLAEEQTAGRGRSGRTWFSPAGAGLWVSVLVRPGAGPARIAPLSIVAAISIAEGVRNATGVDARVKWPNDVVAGGMKLGGVLIESGQLAGAPVDEAIVGLGINVNTEREHFPPKLRGSATSLRIAGGRLVSRRDVLRSVLARLEVHYRRFLAGGLSGFQESWRRLSTTLGCDVDVTCAGRKTSGRVVGLSPGGALVIEGPGGGLAEIWYGDVAVRGDALRRPGGRAKREHSEESSDGISSLGSERG